jgi:hypothetical protein
MKRLYQVETKEKNKMKKLLIKKETNNNRRMVFVRSPHCCFVTVA